MRQANAFDRLHVAKRLLNVLNSENVQDLLNQDATEMVRLAFPIDNDGDIEPQYNRKDEKQAMEDIYQYSEDRKGKIWKTFREVKDFIVEDNSDMTSEELDQYISFIVDNPVNMANYILQKKAQHWSLNWINEALHSKDLTLTSDNLDTVKKDLERRIEALESDNY